VLCQLSPARCPCPPQSPGLPEGQKEKDSKFSLNIGSKGASSIPHINSISVPGGGINDLAASPCGSKLAVACKDGCCRVLDVSSGTVLQGFKVSARGWAGRSKHTALRTACWCISTIAGCWGCIRQCMLQLHARCLTYAYVLVAWSSHPAPPESAQRPAS
jgi:hypothetical protein